MVYVDRLLQLFKYVPREQLTIPDFVFQLSHNVLLYSKVRVDDGASVPF